MAQDGILPETRNAEDRVTRWHQDLERINEIYARTEEDEAAKLERRIDAFEDQVQKEQEVVLNSLDSQTQAAAIDITKTTFKQKQRQGIRDLIREADTQKQKRDAVHSQLLQKHHDTFLHLFDDMQSNASTRNVTPSFDRPGSDNVIAQKATVTDSQLAVSTESTEDHAMANSVSVTLTGSTEPSSSAVPRSASAQLAQPEVPAPAGLLNRPRKPLPLGDLSLGRLTQSPRVCSAVALAPQTNQSTSDETGAGSAGEKHKEVQPAVPGQHETAPLTITPGPLVGSARQDNELPPASETPTEAQIIVSTFYPGKRKASKELSPGHDGGAQPKRKKLDDRVEPNGHSTPRQPPDPPTAERIITFDEVYQDGKPEFKHFITDFPKGSHNKWYILKCEQHGVHFGPSPIVGAAKHLAGIQHDHMTKEHSIAIQTLGYRVLDCTEEQVERNNQMVKQAFDNGYKAYNVNQQTKGTKKRKGLGVLESPSTPTPRSETIPHVAVRTPTSAIGQHHDDDALQQSPSIFPGVTRPVPGELYYGFWPKTKKTYAVVVLPCGDFTSIGMSGSLRKSGLYAQMTNQVNACFEFDEKTRNIRGWAKGYEDGGTLETKRRFPVMFFDKSKSVSWLHARWLTPLNMDDPHFRTHRDFKVARNTYACMNRFANFEEMVQRRGTPGDGSLQSPVKQAQLFIPDTTLDTKENRELDQELADAADRASDKPDENHVFEETADTENEDTEMEIDGPVSRPASDSRKDSSTSRSFGGTAITDVRTADLDPAQVGAASKESMPAPSPGTTSNGKPAPHQHNPPPPVREDDTEARGPNDIGLKIPQVGKEIAPQAPDTGPANEVPSVQTPPRQNAPAAPMAPMDMMIDVQHTPPAMPGNATSLARPTQQNGTVQSPSIGNLPHESGRPASCLATGTSRPADRPDQPEMNVAESANQRSAVGSTRDGPHTTQSRVSPAPELRTSPVDTHRPGVLQAPRGMTAMTAPAPAMAPGVNGLYRPQPNRPNGPSPLVPHSSLPPKPKFDQNRRTDGSPTTPKPASATSAQQGPVRSPATPTQGPLQPPAKPAGGLPSASAGHTNGANAALPSPRSDSSRNQAGTPSVLPSNIPAEQRRSDRESLGHETNGAKEITVQNGNSSASPRPSPAPQSATNSRTSTPTIVTGDAVNRWMAVRNPSSASPHDSVGPNQPSPRRTPEKSPDKSPRLANLLEPVNTQARTALPGLIKEPSNSVTTPTIIKAEPVEKGGSFSLMAYKDEEQDFMRDGDGPYLRLVVDAEKHIAEGGAGEDKRVVIDPALLKRMVIEPLDSGRSSVTLHRMDFSSGVQRLVFETNACSGTLRQGRIQAREFCSWVKGVNKRISYQNIKEPERRSSGGLLHPSQAASSVVID